MTAYIAIFLSLLNLVFLLVLLIRFKKLFSTEKILEKTKAYMDKMVANINSTAHMDMELINDSTKRIREQLKAADIQMDRFNEASDRLRQMIAETDKITKNNQKSVIYQTNKNVENIPSVAHSKSAAQKAYQKINPDAAYKVNKMPYEQKSLFDEEPESKSILTDETLVTKDGAAIKEVPLIITKVYDDEITNNDKMEEKNLNEKVKMLYDAGHEAKEIATELSCSITEVQFIIDML